jgi:hypothetical protein
LYAMLCKEVGLEVYECSGYSKGYSYKVRLDVVLLHYFSKGYKERLDVVLLHYFSKGYKVRLDVFLLHYFSKGCKVRLDVVMSHYIIECSVGPEEVLLRYCGGCVKGFYV